MRATSAIQAATEFGGFDLRAGAGMSADEVRAYFSRENIARMFPGEDASQCGDYSLEECAAAVIDALQAQDYLIAAAPELLEAVRACMLREDIASDELGEMLRAALARAEGNSQDTERR